MTSELIEPSRNNKKLYIVLAAILITAIAIILVAVGINSDPLDQGGG